jgi:hypothetical protein
MRKKKQPMSQEMSCCPPSASSIEAEATANFNQEKENSLAGDMKDEEKVSTEKTDHQPSQGRLDRTEEHCTLETVDERFEELDVEAIQPFGLIPNYVIPSDLKYPVVAKTPLNYFCLDGWNLIEGAKANGKITLKCFIEEIEEHSNEELAIRKVSLREKPRGGISGYAETIRNTTCLRNILTASNLDLKVFQHGGARKGEAFTSSRQENITKVLSFRLRKSESTINQYFSHARFLNDETLTFLVEKEVDKDFFEVAQTNKRWMITNLQSQKVSDEEITLQISESMVEWFNEYTENRKKIRRICNETVVESQSVDHTEVVVPAPRLPQETTNSEVSIAPMISTETCDEPLPGTETSDEVGASTEAFDENDSFETLKFSVDSLANRLHEANALSDPGEYLDRITAEAKNLAILLQKASVLRTKGLPFAKEVL